MDEILETADKEMILGKEELENIDIFEKSLKNERSAIKEQLAQTHHKKRSHRKSKRGQLMQTEIDNAPKAEEEDPFKEEPFEVREAVLKPSLKPDGQYRDK